MQLCIHSIVNLLLDYIYIHTKLELISQMSGIEWDPTGRFVVTGVSSLKSKIDTGYYIWSFQGKIIRRSVVYGHMSLV